MTLMEKMTTAMEIRSLVMVFRTSYVVGETWRRKVEALRVHRCGHTCMS